MNTCYETGATVSFTSTLLTINGIGQMLAIAVHCHQMPRVVVFVFPLIVNDILKLNLGGATGMSATTAVYPSMIRFDAVAALLLIWLKIAIEQE